jgi:hypothetical protein
VQLQELHRITAQLAEELSALGPDQWKATASGPFCWVALASQPTARLNLRYALEKGGHLAVRPEYPRDGRGRRITAGGPAWSLARAAGCSSPWLCSGASCKPRRRHSRREANHHS